MKDQQEKREHAFYVRVLELVNECQSKMCAIHLLLSTLAYPKCEAVSKIADETIKFLDINENSK